MEPFLTRACAHTSLHFVKFLFYRFTDAVVVLLTGETPSLGVCFCASRSMFGTDKDHLCCN